MGLSENDFGVHVHAALRTGIAPKTAEIMRQQAEAQPMENSGAWRRSRRNLGLRLQWMAECYRKQNRKTEKLAPQLDHALAPFRFLMA